MAYTTINKSTDYFNTKLYAGNGGTNNITGVGFQPDWVLIKKRNATANHHAFDAVRGVTKVLKPNESETETTVATTLTSFDSDGFTVGSDTSVNGNLLASWNWKANGQGSSNTDGSINTTYTSVSTTAGFSICLYTGTGSNATVGHGLGVVPEMIIIKEVTGSGRNWRVYHKAMGNGKVMYLNNTNSEVTDATAFNNTSPTSSVFSVGTSGGTNDSGNSYVAYCFAPKTGYSKFGSYVANGNADGGFVYLGFKPSFLMIKRTDSAAGWIIYDSKREGRNTENDYLLASSSSAEGTNNEIDLYSNGFKPREANRNELNVSGGSYIYMAFGQSLVGSNNVPCTAR